MGRGPARGRRARAKPEFPHTRPSGSGRGSSKVRGRLLTWVAPLPDGRGAEGSAAGRAGVGPRSARACGACPGRRSASPSPSGGGSAPRRSSRRAAPRPASPRPGVAGPPRRGRRAPGGRGVTVPGRRRGGRRRGSACRARGPERPRKPADERARPLGLLHQALARMRPAIAARAWARSAVRQPLPDGGGTGSGRGSGPSRALSSASFARGVPLHRALGEDGRPGRSMALYQRKISWRWG